MTNHTGIKKKPAIFIFGATATGKSQLAIDIAKKFAVNLINVDASQVYKGMNIGTAKLDSQTLQEFPHALIDICDPAQAYSSGKFLEDAKLELEIAKQADKIPVFVGGTMLYFKQLLANPSNLPQADEVFRTKMQALLQDKGADFLYQELQNIDANSAQTIDKNNLQRIIRALEIYHITGKTPSQIRLEQTQVQNPLLANWQFIQVGLMPEDREFLHRQIEKRWQKMLDAGFISEVEQLKQRGDLNLEMPSMRAVGYRQIWQYLNGAYEYKDMYDKGLAATRQLAKRQITWLKSWQNANLFITKESDAKQNSSADASAKILLFLEKQLQINSN